VAAAREIARAGDSGELAALKRRVEALEALPGRVAAVEGRPRSRGSRRSRGKGAQ
jgi:hypothetical protein